MLTYRVMHAINHSYPVAVLVMYVCAGVLAMMCMFIHPFATISLFGLGLASLVWVIIAGRLLAWMTRSIARPMIQQGRCPRCGASAGAMREMTANWACDACGAEFEANGTARTGGEHVEAHT